MIFCLSRHISEIRWLHAGLILEFGREIIRRFEVKPIGNLLDALVGGREEFLGALQSQRLLIHGWCHASVFLEEFAETGVADAQFLCDILDGDGFFQGFSNAESSFIDKVHVLSVFIEHDVSLQRVHGSDEMVHDARQGLL